MSSGNLISVVYTKEDDYGVPPSPLASLTLETAVRTNDTLSGTPVTTKSQNVRTDRMSSGQVVTGLDVSGGIDWELANGTFFDDFFSGAMFSNWVAEQLLSTDVTLTPDPADDQKATLVVTGDLSTINVEANDVLQLLPASGSPVNLSVISVTSTTELIVATMRGEAAIVAQAMDVVKPAYLDIGDKITSFRIGKSYLDVQHAETTDNHSQTYGGELVSVLSLSATYGEIVSGSFTMLGNSYEQEPGPSYEQQVVAGGGTVNPAESANGINASIDVPIVTIDGEASTWCMESFGIDLDNGLDARNCIGKAAPTGYDLGEADITVSATIHNSDSSYDDFMAKKLTQEPVSMTFFMQNFEGGYSFHLSAIQLSFPDPSAGANDQAMIEAAGTGKVGPNGSSAMRIYKLNGDQA